MIKRIILLAGVVLLAAGGLYLFNSQSRKPLAVRTPEAPVAAIPAPSNPALTHGSTVAASPALTNASGSREFDIAVNPYAAALREPGKSKRTWDVNFMPGLQKAASGDPISFELTDGRMATGTVRITQIHDGELTYLSGDLVSPETGKFFFLTPPEGGKAGKAVGVIEFPASQTAYRIEPTGPNGDPELWQRRMDEVLCQSMPLDTAAPAAQQPENIPPLRPDLTPNYLPSYNSNVISLQSYPGSRAVLLLDFFGGYTATWGGAAYPKPNVTAEQIKDVWKRVAEDFMGYNINVTTDYRVYTNAPALSRQKCVFTPSTPAMPAGAAGVAYIGSWNWGSDTVCWSIYITGKNAAEVGSHEPGHTLGLGHQNTSTQGYYGGHGAAPTGWGPIMGVGYYQPVSSWAKGEYLDAQNHEDELAIIDTYNNVNYRTDDTGATLAASRYLDIYPDFAASAEGVIERTSDSDAFQFTTSGGQVALAAKPVGDWASLAVMVTLADSTDTVIASNNPQNVIYASIKTNLPAGTYTFRVTGAGRLNPLTNGFSAYGSIGYYSVFGSVEGGRLPNRLSIVERVANGTVVGTIPASVPTDPLAYSIQAGNSNNTFAVDSTGVLTVANNTLLDYTRLSTNSMFPVQFELLVNITNLNDSGLTELNRRVVVSVLGTNLNYPIAVSGFNGRVVVPYNATVATPLATGFDILNNWGLYQAGLNGNAQVAGTGGLNGLPSSGQLLSAVDNSTFQLGPYGNTNALILGRTYPTSGTLTFASPQSYNTLTILASSANGGGLGTLVLSFTNGTRSQVLNFNDQDWYNNPLNVAAQGFGRVRLGQPTFITEDPGWANPNLYQTTLNLAALGLNLPIASVSFTNVSAGGNQNSVVFGISGSLMPPQAVIVTQPQSLTNNNPAASATFTVAAMGAPDLYFQWFKGTPASGTLLPGQNSASLVINPVTTNDAGSYFVIVTNAINSATSSVASLTVYTAPVITQQPSPTNLWLFLGRSLRLSVVANAAIPVSYSWRSNGVVIPGGTLSGFTNNGLQLGDAGAYTVTVSNAFGQATSSVVNLTVLSYPTAPYGQLVLNNNPLGYWRLDETNGTVAHDYSGGNNGAYTSVQLGQPGNNLVDLHKAARFGILANPNSYVASVKADFATSGSASFSIEAWVNGGAQTTDAGIVTKGYGGGGEQFNLDCGGAGRAFRFFVRDAGAVARLASGTVVPNSQWHHLVGVCDQVGGRILLYVDGVSNASGTITAGSGIWASPDLVTFGSRKSGPATSYDNQFVGTIQDVAIYGFPLSPAQVAAHYNSATNRPPVWAVNPFTLPGGSAGTAYSGNIATNASDPNADTMTFARVSGPTWLTVAANGALSGSPANVNAGTNTFVVSARDVAGLSNSATMRIFVNGAPAFASNPFAAPDAPVSAPYSASIAASASDPNGDTVSYSKVSGPAWLNIASDGALSGTPDIADLGINSFTVQATDPASLFSQATMNVAVVTPALTLSAYPQGADLLLSWTGGTGPFQLQVATNLASPIWENLGGLLTTNQAIVSRSNDAAFYRVFVP